MQPLSLHISGPQGKRDGLGPWLEQLNAAGCAPAVIYSVNVDLSPDLRQYSPQTKIIFRVQNDTFNRLPDDFWNGDPRANAARWINGQRDQAGRTQLQTWLLNPADWYDPLNEPVIGTVEQARWLNTWMIEAINLTAARGVKLALFSFSTGSPEYSLWQHLIPALEVGKFNGAVLSLHAYNDGGLCERDAAGLLTPEAVHNSFRHWQIYETLPEAARLPLVYTEASAGNGYATVPDEMWLNDLIAYGQVVKNDPYLLSACAFQCGGSESNCYQALPAYGDAIVGADWTSAEAPSPEGFDFVVVSHLVPQDVTPAEYDLVHAAALPARQDILFSADIARANALRGQPGSRVIVWEPRRWSSSIEDFLAPAEVELRTFPTADAGPFWVAWPVGGGDPPYITDPFNAPRPYANGKHEGLDCRAYIQATMKSAPVLAAQDGVVERVRGRGDNPSYGLHLVIRHPWGAAPDRYRTLYAHLASIKVSEGQEVKIGDVIGLAGKSGTTALHLHFGVYDAVAGLKGYFRCSGCSAGWPEGVLNPADVLRLDSPYNVHAWHGLQMRADGHSTQVDFDCLRVAQLDAAKLMTNTDFNELYTIIKAGLPPERIVLRLFADFRDRVVKPDEFYDWQRAWLGEFVRAGGRHVEVHNEPNLEIEGLGTSWVNAEGFRAWYEIVARYIRSEFPTVLIGWPGLSPQPNVPEFILQINAAIAAGVVDWIGAHAYWQNAAEMDSPAGGRYYRNFLGLGKPVIITEFSNCSNWDGDDTKGAQYKRYYNTLERGVLGAFAFVSSASEAEFNRKRETWARGGLLSQIPSVVGT